MAPAPGGRGEILPGTLDMLILHTLTLGSMHGYAIAQHIGRLSEDVLRVEQGSLYPALDRLQRQGWVKSEWRATPAPAPSRAHTITAPPRERLAAEACRPRRAMSARRR